MDPFTMMMIGGAAAQVGGGILGYFLGKGDRETADRLQREAIARFGEASEEAINSIALEVLGPTEMAKIQTDPALRDAQMGALRQLQEVGASGGMTLADDARLAKLDNGLSRAERNANNSLKYEMDSRGIGGSGTELAMRRANSQDSLQRRSEAAMDVNGQAQKRALEAMIAAGNMGGDIRGQDWGEKSQVAQAQDLINRYNTGAANDLSMWQGQASLGAAETMLGAQTGMAQQKRQDGAQKAAVAGGAGQGVGQGMQYGAVYGTKPGGVGAAAQPKVKAAVETDVDPKKKVVR